MIKIHTIFGFWRKQPTTWKFYLSTPDWTLYDHQKKNAGRVKKCTYKYKSNRKLTWEGGGATENPRSAAMERASAMPPMRLMGFLPTQVVSQPIDMIFDLIWQTRRAQTVILFKISFPESGSDRCFVIRTHNVVDGSTAVWIFK